MPEAGSSTVKGMSPSFVRDVTVDFRWLRGRGLGGSSAVNYMAWTRPRREDVNGEDMT